MLRFFSSVGLEFARNLLGIGSDHIRVIPTSCSELIGICSEKFRAISKVGSDFTDAAFRADMRVSEQNHSEPLENASFRSETVGESKDLQITTNSAFFYLNLVN